MRLSDLDFQYPTELIATEPQRPSRVAFVEGEKPPVELTLEQLISEKFRPGDLLVLNESQVIPARLFSDNETEILFLSSLGPREWQVLFPAREYKVGDKLTLPDQVTVTLKVKGLPQVVEASREIAPEYFQKHGEVALPPYIQEARSERHNRPEDRSWYQSTWAKNPGSVAAPTASLHFQPEHLAALEAKGVDVARLTLHVGAGTFLPIRSEIEKHEMHSESVTIPHETREAVRATKARGGRVWALGTTVARSLEAWGAGHFEESGETRLFIKPPYQFKVVDALLTNFHQPRSTLVCLVAAFAGLAHVKRVYHWAIERKFRLFSYGDLSAWTR